MTLICELERFSSFFQYKKALFGCILCIISLIRLKKGRVEKMRKLIQFLFIAVVLFLVEYVLINQAAILFLVTSGIIQLCGVIIAIRLLLFDQRNTSSKVAWVAVIFILPVLGTISYLVFGRNPATRKFSTAQVKEKTKLINAIHAIPNNTNEKLPRLSKRIAHLTSIEPIKGNKIEILTNGEETFPVLLDALRKAENHIHIQYYIFKTDAISTEIRDILVEKAKSGVEVRFMFDGLGSSKLGKAFLAPLKEAGVSIHAFDPIASLIVRTANLRNHRKIVVIDGQIGFTGGLNIGEEYRSNTPDFRVWRDTHIKITGQAVIELQESFLNDWVYMENQAGAADGFISESGLKQYFSPVDMGDEWAQVIYGGPYDKEKWVRDSMLDLIDSAKESVWIVSPYFVPDEESLAVIRRVAMSGVDVRVIIPGKGDRGISFHGSNAYVKTMIEAGAKMYAYADDSFVHAKAMLVDGTRAAIGTANFDVRSFRLNHELMVFLYDESEAMHHLKRDFKKDFEDSRLFTMKDMENKPLLTRIKEVLSSLLSPIL